MFFPLSKILWFVVEPLNAVLLLGLTAIIATALRFAMFGRFCLWSAILLLLLAAASPLGPYAAHILETRFPAHPRLPATIAGIVVLGGSPDVGRSAAWGMPVLSAQGERLTSLVTLGRRYPEAKIVYTGGYGGLGRAKTREAAVARHMLADMGFSTARVIFEDKSRNTRENALFSKALIGDAANGPWVLVTGAMHMPRAVTVFRAAGWNVLPYPVSPLTAAPDAPWRPLDPGLTLAATTGALHEWLGLIGYRLAGYTNGFWS